MTIVIFIVIDKDKMQNLCNFSELSDKGSHKKATSGIVRNLRLLVIHHTTL